MNEIELYQKGRNLINTSKHIIQNARAYRYEKVIALMKVLTLQLASYVETVAIYDQATEYSAGFPSVEEMSSDIKSVMDAQENKDYVLLADYVELLIIPMLENVQQVLRNIFGELGANVDEELLKRNLAALEKASDANIASKIAEADIYNLEDTNSGWPTFARTDRDGVSYYLHSNINPSLEGEIQADEYYDSMLDEYLILGGGLGYLALALLKKNGYLKVAVYEYDYSSLKTMLSVNDFSNYIDKGRLRIVCDNKLEHFRKAITAISDHQKIILHEPSIRGVADDRLKADLYQYFYKEIGIRTHRELLKGNFYQNTKRCHKNVDEISSGIEGKTVILVAAGPSISKQYEQLKNRSEGTVLIAVTTMYRKLVREGIIPDYVVHIDPQEKTFWHLTNVDCDAPLLLLSTAYEGCSGLNPENTYIVYQKDYNLSEDAAKEKNCNLYETGGSVSCVALDIAVRLKAKRVVITGLDLAYTDGLAHASGVSRQDAGDMSEAHMVDGYYGGKVPSSLLFADMIRWFSNYAKEHSASGVDIINATEGGADIPGIRKMPLADSLK